MGKIFDSVTTFLKADGWPVQRIGRDEAYSMMFEGQHGEWTCIAQVDEPAQMFVFYSACPVEAPPLQRASVAELLSRINFQLMLGDFEMDFADGHIRCRTSIDITGHPLGARLVQQVVYKNVFTMDRYLPAIQAVVQGADPAEALAALPPEE